MSQRKAASSAKPDVDNHNPVREVVMGPFGGYVPNATNVMVGVGVDSSLTDWRAAIQLNGFVPRGEALAPDYGWQRSTPDEMPLGGYESGGGYAPSATGQPIVHIVLIPAEVSPNGIEENLVVTAATPTTHGTIWRYPDLGLWRNMPTIAGTADGGTDAIVTTSREMWDSALYMPGHTVLMCDGIGSNYTNQPAGLLRYYTGQRWGQFPMPDGIPNSFGCVSVCTHQDRVLVLATREEEGLHPNRIRWTTVGWSTNLNSPISMPTDLFWNDAGAGAIDIEEDVGAGVAIREMGNQIIVYFKHGVVMLERTGVYTRPYQRAIITTKRGLVGTQAITDIGNSIHFGVFNDGWFFIGPNGQFKEAGTTQIKETTVRKWSQTFYDRLNQANAYRTIVTYEPSRHFIKICFPDGDDAVAPNTVWTYDIYGDRVWPDNYLLGIGNENPLAWGDTVTKASAGVAWDDLAGTWEAATGIWGGPEVLSTLFTHGTADGILYQHTPSLVSRDGIAPTYQYVSAPQDFGDPSQFSQIQQVLLHYAQTNISSGDNVTPVTIGLLDGSTGAVVAEHTLTPTTNNSLLPKVIQAWFRNPLIQAQLSITGTHPFVMRGFEVQWLPNMGDMQ